MSDKVNYFEIGTPDAQTSRDFYGGLFGWSFTGPTEGYQLIDTDKGGLWDTSAVGGGSWAIFYVQVDDVQAVVDKATELGAKVLVPFTDSPAIQFAHLSDPSGMRFGVWRPNDAEWASKLG